MTIRYEANPPKILSDVNTDESIRKFLDRVKIISKKCDAIHLTENVLGHERVSPIKIAEIIKREIPEIPITVSLRVRDKNEKEIEKFVNNCISIGITGILIIMGDPTKSNSTSSGLIPSLVVSNLKNKKYDSKIELYLSISNKPNFSKVGKKIESNPKGFMTQVVQNIQQVQNLSDNLKTIFNYTNYLIPIRKKSEICRVFGIKSSRIQ